MAQIDHSIYLQQQAPDFAGNILQGLKAGMSMRDLADKRALQQKQLAEEQGIKDAYAAGVVQNPDGTTSFDSKKTLSSLYKVSPQKAVEYEQQIKTQDIANQEAKKKRFDQTVDFFGRAVNGIKDQNSYIAAMNEAKGLGLDVSAMPQQWSPEAQQKINFYAGQVFTAKDRFDQEQKNLENKRKDQELGLKREELGIKRAEAVNKAKSGGRTEGIKQLDKDFAKDFNEWTSGGAEIAKSEIEKLSTVVGDFKNKKVTTGGITGLFPDRITSNNVLKARADVQSSIMNSLRPILGAQFTEKEGERIIKNTWNESDSTENNLARIERLVSNLQAQADEKNKKSMFFQKYGTLDGYEKTPTQTTTQTPSKPSWAL